MKSKRITRMLALTLAAALTLGLAAPALAVTEQGNVEYTGTAGREFLYDLGTHELFRYKSVMPGDTRTAAVSVKNTSATQVSMYLRAQPGTQSKAGFLEQLTFNVYLSGQAAPINAGLTMGGSTWPGSGYQDADAPGMYYVYLGTFETGEEAKLSVELKVPLEMGDAYQNATGEIVWSIAVVELAPPTPSPSTEPTPTPYYPPFIPDVPDDDPIPLGPPVSVDDIPLSPYTGGNDSDAALLIICVAVVAVVLAGTVFVVSKRKKRA